MVDTAVTLARAQTARAQIPEFGNYIGGQWVASQSGTQFDNLNPADTSDIVGRFAASSAADAKVAVDAAATAFPTWRATSIGKRAKILERAADYLEAQAARFAEEMTR
ncbi:MAG: aldehyde dehydrogenase family protein, partial [Xanthobacteraceae bacterium]